MGFERVARNIDPRFDGRNAVIDDQTDGDLAQTHPEHFEEPDRGVREPRAQPEIEESKNDNADDERDERQDAADHERYRIHGWTLREAFGRGKSNPTDEALVDRALRRAMQRGRRSRAFM